MDRSRDVDPSARFGRRLGRTAPGLDVFGRVRAAQGAVMDRGAYHADAAALRASDQVTGDIWKLERSQVFFEAGDSAWEAFASGDWERVLDIFDGERAAIRDDVARYARFGLRLRRLRIVELPPTPYLQWEMHSHRIFVESGFEIRVLGAERVRHLEGEQPLPELMVYGGRTLYHVRYDERWAPIGAKRIDDPALAESAAHAITALYDQAEPLMDFFQREIAGRTQVAGRG
ncbi:DUF6879 family protein [Nocardiopsis mangrovi]|uniref:DUF6879 family protein n=1 Tax=Nocardiopsis mangrovi TaxID=1179818 RepID=A0ABV9DZ19_9ACTN